MGAIKRSSVFVAVLLGCFAGSARAQETITVKIPFPFVVAHEELPAGQYDVRMADGGGSLFSMEGMKNKSAAFAFTIPADGRDPIGDRPALVFTRYENAYRLSQIWESTTTGRDLLANSSTRRNQRSETQPGSDVPAYVLAANWK